MFEHAEIIASPTALHTFTLTCLLTQQQHQFVACDFSNKLLWATFEAKQWECAVLQQFDSPDAPIYTFEYRSHFVIICANHYEISFHPYIPPIPKQLQSIQPLQSCFRRMTETHIRIISMYVKKHDKICDLMSGLAFGYQLNSTEKRTFRNQVRAGYFRPRPSRSRKYHHF